MRNTIVGSDEDGKFWKVSPSGGYSFLTPGDGLLSTYEIEYVPSMNRFFSIAYGKLYSYDPVTFERTEVPSGGNLVDFSTIAAVPEPATLVGLGLGALALAARRRRR